MSDFEARALIGWLARVFASQPIRTPALRRVYMNYLDTIIRYEGNYISKYVLSELMFLLCTKYRYLTMRFMVAVDKCIIIDF